MVEEREQLAELREEDRAKEEQERTEDDVFPRA